MRRLVVLAFLILGCGELFCPAATLCVWTNSPHPGAPYNAWTNAARDIQTAVNAAWPGDVVLVTNGVYETGSSAAATHIVSNRVLIATSIVVRSVNGPSVTAIRGRATGESGERRCAYITGGGQLAGFTLTNGSARGGSQWQDGLGGGALIERGGTVSNCVVCSNSALYGGGIAIYYGGAARSCLVCGNAAGFSGSYYCGGGLYGMQGAVVSDSVFSNNVADVGGGVGFEGSCSMVRSLMIGNQAYSGAGLSLKTDAADNCVIVSNVALRSGGGISFSAGYGLVRNCTVAGNVAQQYPDHSGTYHVQGGSLVNCILVCNGDGTENLDASLNYTADHLCTTPMPSNGTGHITADPLLTTNWRISSNSPCIDAAGTNGPADDYARVARPLDGNQDGTNAWDIGAYEYVHPLADSDGDGLRDTNEVSVGSSPILPDTDGDGMGDNAEVRAGTDFLSATSYLFVAIVNSSTGNAVSWPSVSGKKYALDRATNLVTGARFANVISNLTAIPPLNVYTDATAAGAGPWMYRIRLN